MKLVFAFALLLGSLAFAQTDSVLPPDLQRQVDRIRSQSHYPNDQPPSSISVSASMNETDDSAADAEDNAKILGGAEPVSLDDLAGSPEARDREEQKLKETVAAAERRVDRMAAKLETARRTGAASAPAIEQELARRKEMLDLVNQRTALISELIEMTEAVVIRPSGARIVGAAALRYDGLGRLIRPSEFAQLSIAFSRRFGRPIPVSAWGESLTHAELGFDHRGRIDVAVYPDSPEGLFIRSWLEKQRIPYFAFRRAVPASATGPHIHIGPGSFRFARASAARSMNAVR